MAPNRLNDDCIKQSKGWNDTTKDDFGYSMFEEGRKPCGNQAGNIALCPKQTGQHGGGYAVDIRGLGWPQDHPHRPPNKKERMGSSPDNAAYKWIKAHGSTYGFKPYSGEYWHWNNYGVGNLLYDAGVPKTLDVKTKSGAAAIAAYKASKKK